MKWGDLQWIVEDYKIQKEKVALMFHKELEELWAAEKGSRERLAVKLRLGWEAWGRSGLRHCASRIEFRIFMGLLQWLFDVFLNNYKFICVFLCIYVMYNTCQYTN